MDKTISPGNIRPLTARDLDPIIEIDAKYSLRTRRGFFEKRLTAALAHPKEFVYIGYEKDNRILGFALARLAEGEFGQLAPVALLDAIAIDPMAAGGGAGRAMLAGLAEVLIHKGVKKLQSEVDWRNRSMVQFFAGAGFSLAGRHVLEYDLSVMPREATLPPRPEKLEIDYSDPEGDDFDAVARDMVPCRSLRAADLPALVRIGKAIFGHDRTAYYRRKMDEVLNESGIQVSMVAEVDGDIAGFVMARIDFGDFGRAEPAAVIDTLEVSPAHAHAHVGTALLSQLFANLATLRIDVVRTALAWNQFDLLAFLAANKFAPSQCLVFERRLF
jgi:ribosomal protein S18 acetylase RimI-like enzyme